MAAIGRWMPGFLQRPPSPMRGLATSSFHTLDKTQKVEEETLAWYKPSLFYPVRLGEVFKSRYRVVGKLGYGAYSTVWLCRDLVGHRYVTMKVCERNAPQARREASIYRHLNSIRTSHSGATLIRSSLDDFELAGTDGTHQCLVHKPLGMSLNKLRAQFPDRKLPENLVKLALKHVFYSLDFLHTEARVIHTDIQLNNIIMGIDDESVLAKYEQAERDEPCARKIDGGRITYCSRELSPPRSGHGRPVLCDFGEARFGEADYDDDVQPYLYRAPEIILQMRWTSKIDIWNVGVLIWDMFENKHLFDARDAKGEDSSAHHLAEMIALLGPPPNAFLERCQLTSKYFDEAGGYPSGGFLGEANTRSGELRGGVEVPDMSLETSEENLEGANKARFLQFVRKMLRWLPEERQTARELLEDQWLNEGI